MPSGGVIRPVYPRLVERSIIDAETECWLWLGHTVRGYGRISVTGVAQSVHRVAFEMFVAEIPDGLVIDHLCLTKNCWNPWHLDVVTGAENTRRAAALVPRNTHCPNNHAYEGDNLYITPAGVQHCRTCKRDFMRRSHRARRQAKVDARAAAS